MCSISSQGMKTRPLSPAAARALRNFATFEGNVSWSLTYWMPASVVLEKTKRREGRVAYLSRFCHMSTPLTQEISSISSTVLPPIMPRRQVWYFPPRSFKIFAGTQSSSPIGWIIWTAPSKPALSFIFCTIQSMKHLRKLPSPNCNILVSIVSFRFVDRLYQIPKPRRNPVTGKNVIKRRRGNKCHAFSVPRKRGSIVIKTPNAFTSSARPACAGSRRSPCRSRA